MLRRLLLPALFAAAPALADGTATLTRLVQNGAESVADSTAAPVAKADAVDEGIVRITPDQTKIITLDQDADRNFGRQQVFNRLGDLDLPSGVTPSVSPLTSPSGLIYRYTLQSPDRSPTELKTFEDWVVEPQFRSVAGVADDSGFGGGSLQYQVLLDQYRLAGAGLR